MATTVITGRDVNLTITSATLTGFDAQALSATITKNVDRQVYQTLDGEAYKTTNVTGTLDFEILADWGATSSICEAIWGQLDTNYEDTFAVTMVTATGASFAFTCLADYPTAGGAGTDAQTVKASWKIYQGIVTLTVT